MSQPSGLWIQSSGRTLSVISSVHQAEELMFVIRRVGENRPTQKPAEVYQSCKLCFTAVQSVRATTFTQWQDDSTIMEVRYKPDCCLPGHAEHKQICQVVLNAMWISKGLPDVPGLKDSAGANAKPPLPTPDYREQFTRLLSSLSKVQNRQGRALGRYFEHAPGRLEICSSTRAEY